MAEPQNSRFDSDDEEGRCTPSPEAKKRKLSVPPCIQSDVMKGSETDYGDFVLDRTESNNGCFNCDGNHHLNECPEPKDFKKIRQRQTEMRNRNNNTPRYHSDGRPSEKKFRAGRISDELRNALGIGRNDIPEYIYRMRKMGFIDGYPPGYLKKAIERDTSDEVLKFHMVDEAATTEAEEPTDSPPPKINADKMIYYCGFNQTYRDLRDMENFRVPPFLEFVAFHQETLNKVHAKKMEERRKIRERMVRLAKKRQNVLEVLEEGEIIILDPPPPPPIVNGDGDDCIIIDCEQRKTPSPTMDAVDTPKGSSMRVIVGTPVLMRRRGDEGDIVQESKPSLENFSKGIVPFEAHEEDTPHKGFLKKIMGKLKKFASTSH
ncbi:hypothetical protein NECAME_02909 [Necator americanus]|uniref:PSP proline-rich domain-containing protein n=1 Tax=Necator americanus TaxID=51031 RepID=W2TBU4_NECAM|nr:hypothetical protein NECAME_02909 [Necator americanus]ETN78472.1 hypothetical protein NECAME_02909 [Necator americanus]